MMNLPSTARAVWTLAELFLVYHKDRKGKRHRTPKQYVPDDGIARFGAKPEDREACLNIQGHEPDDDVQMRLHHDKIIMARKQRNDGWSGVVIEQDHIRVRAAGLVLKINPDGGVVLEQDSGTTFIEPDGQIIRKTHDADVIVTGDGRRVSRRTADQIDAFTEDGFVSRKRQV